MEAKIETAKKSSYKPKTWQEKLEDGKPRIVKATGKFAAKFGNGMMLIPTPKLVNELIAQIPMGKLATVNQIRERLANLYHVDYTCPLTTGIFTWICSNAAEEARANGEKNIVPWWRIVKEDGGLNPKAPGGIENHARLLREEGFQIVRKSLRSNRPVVKNAADYFIRGF